MQNTVRSVVNLCKSVIGNDADHRAQMRQATDADRLVEELRMLDFERVA
jgi:hypothetical protein